MSTLDINYVNELNKKIKLLAEEKRAREMKVNSLEDTYKNALNQYNAKWGVNLTVNDLQNEYNMVKESLISQVELATNQYTEAVTKFQTSVQLAEQEKAAYIGVDTTEVEILNRKINEHNSSVHRIKGQLDLLIPQLETVLTNYSTKYNLSLSDFNINTEVERVQNDLKSHLLKVQSMLSEVAQGIHTESAIELAKDNSKVIKEALDKLNSSDKVIRELEEKIDSTIAMGEIGKEIMEKLDTVVESQTAESNFVSRSYEEEDILPMIGLDEEEVEDKPIIGTNSSIDVNSLIANIVGKQEEEEDGTVNLPLNW